MYIDDKMANMSATQPTPPPSPQIIPEVYINFCGEINYPSVNRLMDSFSKLVTFHKTKTVHFLISSPGGSVDAGIALYNFLIALPITLNTYNMGSIDSIANMIFIAGQNRFAMPSSTFLFHGIKWTFFTNAQFTLFQLNEVASKMEQDEKKIAEILSKRTNMTVKEIKKLFVKGESKSLDFAKTKGIIHDILALKIPTNAQVYNIQ